MNMQASGARERRAETLTVISRATNAGLSSGSSHGQCKSDMPVLIGFNMPYEFFCKQHGWFDSWHLDGNNDCPVCSKERLIEERERCIERLDRLLEELRQHTEILRQKHERLTQSKQSGEKD